jgi:1-acyl-sn-glycerol-3-phosphate acyltransferase
MSRSRHDRAAATARAHRTARARRPGRLYAVVRVLVAGLLRLWFRIRVTGAEHVPEGGAVIAANHKSFLDPFFIGVATRRHLRTMAKASIFRGPLGGVLVRLGAFPVHRGEGDAEALATAGAILDGGGLVVVFPEGTRVDEPDALGSPHHGAGRLALGHGVPIVPVALAGTAHLWLGPVPKPRRVGVSFLAPVETSGTEEGPVRAQLEDLIDRQVWPAVQSEYGRLRATPGPVALLLTAVGLGGLAARRRAARGRPRLLGVIDPRSVRHRRRRRALRDRMLRR